MITIDIKKKPIIVKGINLTQSMLETNFSFSMKDRKLYVQDGEFIIETLEGDMKAEVGDWLIIGIEKEIYPCNKEIFEKTYDIVNNSQLINEMSNNDKYTDAKKTLLEFNYFNKTIFFTIAFGMFIALFYNIYSGIGVILISTMLYSYKEYKLQEYIEK